MDQEELYMQEQIQKYYDEFHGVGEPAIVRNNHVNDAFEVVVLIMYTFGLHW